MCILRFAVRPALALISVKDARIIDPLASALKDLDGDVQNKVVVALFSLNDHRVSDQVERALSDPSTLAFDSLILALKDSNDQVRCAAAGTLQRIGDKRSVEPLLDALRDTSGHVRSAAAKALGPLQDSRAVNALLVALQDSDEQYNKDKWRDPRIQVAAALGQLRDSRAVESLIVALADDNEQVRSASVSALAEIGDRRAVQPLIAALARGNTDAIPGLGQLRDPQAVEPLIAYLDDRTTNWFSPRVMSTQEHWKQAIEGRIQSQDKEGMAEIFVMSLCGAVWKHRANAVRALGRIGTRRAVEALISVFENRSESSATRFFAASWLGQIAECKHDVLVSNFLVEAYRSWATKWGCLAHTAESLNLPCWNLDLQYLAHWALVGRSEVQVEDAWRNTESVINKLLFQPEAWSKACSTLYKCYLSTDGDPLRPWARLALGLGVADEQVEGSSGSPTN